MNDQLNLVWTFNRWVKKICIIGSWKFSVSNYYYYWIVNQGFPHSILHTTQVERILNLEITIWSKFIITMSIPFLFSRFFLDCLDFFFLESTPRNWWHRSKMKKKKTISYKLNENWRKKLSRHFCILIEWNFFYSLLPCATPVSGRISYRME